MDLDRIDWTIYKQEDAAKAITKPHFYFALAFAVLFAILLGLN